MSDKFLSEEAKKSIKAVAGNYEQKRQKALDDLGVTQDDYRDQMTKIRQKVFDNFEGNLEVAKNNLRNNGFRVYDAENIESAQLILRNILVGSEKIVKSKTNLGKEIGLEKLLEEIGQSGFETDLGDFVVDFMGEEDQHYVLPGIHLESKKIAEKIEEVLGDKVEADPRKLTQYFCRKIREKILEADTGITGANFFTKTGQIVLLENEGNISLVSRLPRKHVVVCGIDKLTDSAEDAISLCKTAAIFGTGQKITQYISVISGPSKTADIENKLVEGAQGAQEVHVVLVDNGRRRMLENGFEGMLRCINCGSCINFCPVYRQMGKKYGGKFAGSKGVIMAAFTGKGTLEDAKRAGSFHCTLCDSCWKNCPMKISLMWHVRDIRKMQNKRGLQTEANKKMLDQVEKFGNPFGGKNSSKKSDELYCC